MRFTRRAVRAALGLSDTQLRVHLDRLVQLEYVAAHGGRMGQCFSYSLLFDGDTDADAPQLMGLSDEAEAETVATSRGSGANLAGQSTNLAGRLRSGRGPVAATSRGGESAKKPSKARVNGHASASDPETARSRRLPATEH